MQGERRYPRISTANAVLVSRLGDEELDGFVRTREMSAGGCCFVSSEKQEVHNLLKLLISIRHQVVEVRGRVVYVNTVEGGNYEIGVEFLDIKEKDASKIAALFEAEVGPSPSLQE